MLNTWGLRCRAPPCLITYSIQSQVAWSGVRWRSFSRPERSAWLLLWIWKRTWNLSLYPNLPFSKYSVLKVKCINSLIERRNVTDVSHLFALCEGNAKEEDKVKLHGEIAEQLAIYRLSVVSLGYRRQHEGTQDTTCTSCNNRSLLTLPLLLPRFPSSALQSALSTLVAPIIVLITQKRSKHAGTNGPYHFKLKY